MLRSGLSAGAEMGEGKGGGGGNAETNRIQFVLVGMQNRRYGPQNLAARRTDSCSSNRIQLWTTLQVQRRFIAVV
jgi:hypothetical protein